MQQPLIKLREIVWEITGKCNNKCLYCGSKENWNEKINEEKIKKIADNIVGFSEVNYPVEINFSGGDPLLIPIETLKYCVTLLKDKGCKCKIIINPKSLHIFSPDEFNNISNLFDWTGISVNTKNEIAMIDANKKYLSSNITYITNFNISNVFLFDELLKSVDNKLWQIQFTVYKNENDENAIYNNEEALEYLSKKITETIDNGKNIIIADNASHSQCGAGTSSIGILSNGDVVPCLSMRSWLDIEKVIEGNLLKESLSNIWESGFGDYRFCEFKCCKDHCKNKKISLDKECNINNINNINIGIKKEKITKNLHMVLHYGVAIPKIMAYAVGNNEVVAYAVTDKSSTDIKYKTWSSDNTRGKE